MVLIAGAMHGAWTWDRVSPLLRHAGHDVTALDLPGMGKNRPVAKADVTLRLWAEYVADSVREVGEPVILVGHSRGGLVIGEAAERVAEHVRGLIYVTALIVPPGKTAMMVSGKWDSDAKSVPLPDARTVPFTAEQATAMFYNRCTAEDAAWAAARLELEPAAPIVTPSEVTWERWGRLPRAYIECVQDRILSIERQRMIQAAAPCDPVLQLDTDHSPFLSAPTGLCDALTKIARIWSG